jgi:hypothetical protein
MAGPGDEIAAGKAGRGHLRASHAGREQVIGTLKAAFVQGMLTKDELDLRVGQTLAARTYAELAALTADLPAGLTTAKPPVPARAQDGGQPVLRPGPVATVVTGLYAGVWAYAILFPKGGDNGELVFFGGVLYLIILAICLWWAVTRAEERPGGQSPRRPASGAGGQASRYLPSAVPDRQIPPTRDHPRHIAEAAPSRRPRPLLPVWRARLSMPFVR